jgi:outer membrane protein assembly factor BamB
MQTLFIGIKGTVLALNSATGAEVWRTELKGMSFVNLSLTGEHVLAATKGELFCLDRSTGTLLWHNRLKGLGHGLMTVATEPGSSQAAVLAEELQRETATAAAAGTGASSAG